MLAVLFPGQGSERAGMGLDAIARSSTAREAWERAAALTGVDVAREVARSGPALSRTEVLQPVLAAACLGLWSLLESAGVRAGAFAGHSLGELCAWSAAGGAGALEAVEVAARRGRAMARTAGEFPGGMLALTGADESTLARALARGMDTPGGVLDVAAHNAPDEWALSGTEPALRAVLASERSVRLAVSGPWHSPRMAGARDEVRGALAGVPPRSLGAALVANASGLAVRDEREARERMIEGLAVSVRWVDSLRTLAALGATRFLVVGPGRALRATVRKTLGERSEVLLAEDVASAERAVRELS